MMSVGGKIQIFKNSKNSIKQNQIHEGENWKKIKEKI